MEVIGKAALGLAFLSAVVGPAFGQAGRGPSARWVGQDGKDFVGPHNRFEPSDVQDVHIAISGLDPRREVKYIAVLATQGAAGASVEAAGVTATRPISSLPGPIVDTMGAGDAAFASTLASLAQGQPQAEEEWGDVLEKAMDAAAATCRFEGALLRLPSALEDTDLDAIGT